MHGEVLVVRRQSLALLARSRETTARTGRVAMIRRRVLEHDVSTFVAYIAAAVVAVRRRPSVSPTTRTVTLRHRPAPHGPICGTAPA